jgi:transposase
MVLKMEEKELIRKLVIVQGMSQREVNRRFGWSRDSIADAIRNPEPNSYTLKAPRPRPLTDPVLPLVKQWLEEDRAKPRKQRHTKTRIFERLRDEYDFKGSRRAISDLVTSLLEKPAEVFCPIDHPPASEVQIDWGQAIVMLRGAQTKVMIFCARSAFSKATFVRAYLRDDMVSFLDGHVWLMEQLGGVPIKLAYDNLKTAVSYVHTGRMRDLTSRFLALRSHYLFESRFCNVASGNEKGHVENSVKRSERTYLTPVPQVSSLEALNEHLAAWTKRDLGRIDKDMQRSYGELFEEERKLFRPLPESPFLACTSDTLRVDKRSTVPHQQSRYSVPTRYACKHVVLRAFLDRIEVHCEDQVIATHARVEEGDWSLQLSHYIELLETKPGLLDSGKPFVKQAWTQSQQLFRNELEYRYHGEGTRMFIDILLLAKRYQWKDVCRAIDACCKNHAFNEAAVLLELENIGTSQPNKVLDLSAHPLLQQSETGTRSLECYDSLIDSSIDGEAQQDSIDPSLGEPDSFSIARSANHDCFQEDQDESNQVQPDGVVSGPGISPSFSKATDNAHGVPTTGQKMLFV